MNNLEQAAAHQKLADRAFAQADRHAAQDNERAEVKAIQEGRREQAIADRYRAAAAADPAGQRHTHDDDNESARNCQACYGRAAGASGSW